MTLDEYNALCASMVATTHVVQWGDNHVWKVGGKVFAIGGVDKELGFRCSFKTSEQNYLFLENIPGYRPAPYLASRGMKWIQQYDAPDSEDDALRYYIEESHRIVALGLSKKKQRELGLSPEPGSQEQP